MRFEKCVFTSVLKHFTKRILKERFKRCLESILKTFEQSVLQSNVKVF